MIREFIYKYYIDPIRYGLPYNAVDTLTYAIILIVCTWLVYRWLKLHNITIDREFIYALIPWVVFGGCLRVVNDTGVITSDLRVILTTPLIFFLIFALVMLVLHGSCALEEKGVIRSWKKSVQVAGIFLVLSTLVFLTWFGLSSAHLDLLVAGSILGMAIASSSLLFALLRFGFGWQYMHDRLYQILIFGHMLDASATSFGIDLHSIPYQEQHVVGSTLIEMTGTAFVMFPLKLLVLIPGIYILEHYRRESATSLWYLIIFAMIMVGLAPGVRDMVRMVLYV